jgi:hypothetical protein
MQGTLIVYKSLRTNPEDLSVLDLFDRILEKGIVFDPWARVVLVGIDLRRSSNRIVVAPERRRLPFIVPATSGRSTKAGQTGAEVVQGDRRIQVQAALT